MASPSQGKLLIVLPKLSVGGTERHLLQVLPRLDRTRFRVQVLTLRGRGSLDGELRAAGVPVITAPSLFGGKANAAMGAARLIAYLAGSRPDIVHFFLPEAYTVGGFVSRLARRAKGIVSRRSLNDYQRARPLARGFEAWLHKRMDAIIGNSQAVVRQLREEGAPPERLGLIYNGIDLERYGAPDREQERRRLGISDDTLVLTMVATLLSYKGHDLLLDALAPLRGELPEPWLLLLAGRDEGIGQGLKEKAARLGLASNIRWLGESGSVPGLLRASDLALLCSHQEGFPNAVLEAMAAGLPVIATRVGGVPEAVEDGESGILVPPADPQRLGAAILGLAKDPEARRRLGTAGRQRVGAHFSIGACVAAYERLYDAVLVNDPRPLAEVLEGNPQTAAAAGGSAP